MFAVKAFLESVEGACSDVAKNYTQGADNQYKGSVFEGMAIGSRVGGGKVEVIEKWGIQSNLIIKASENENLPKDLYLPRQILLFPVPIEIAVRALKRLP